MRKYALEKIDPFSRPPYLCRDVSISMEKRLMTLTSFSNQPKTLSGSLRGHLPEFCHWTSIGLLQAGPEVGLQSLDIKGFGEFLLLTTDFLVVRKELSLMVLWQNIHLVFRQQCLRLNYFITKISSPKSWFWIIWTRVTHQNCLLPIEWLHSSYHR